VRVVFLGPPGAGKGTQAAAIADRFGLVRASTGDIFREAISEGSELGHRVKAYLDSGRLVPDDLTSRVVEERVVAVADSYVLDGFPRTLAQAEHLAAMLARRGQALDGVIYFALSDEEAAVRLTGRRVCGDCGANFHVEFMPTRIEGVCDNCGGELKMRSDSSEQVVRRRLAEYHEKTEPVVRFYEEQGILARVAASAGPDEVTKATEDVLRRL